MIRVLLVDDHPIVRQGLTAALEDESDLQVAGSAASAEEALDLAQRLRPDVVLLDLELPGMDGVEAIPRLLDASPEAGVLIFTAYDTEERVLGAVHAGARGYLLKGAPASEIAAAIRSVAQGGSVLTPRIAALVMASMHSPRGARLLTSREREVLQLIAEGLASKQIARSLKISERTVKFHTTALLRKLEADNRAQAVAQAAQRGLLHGNPTRQPASGSS